LRVFAVKHEGKIMIIRFIFFKNVNPRIVKKKSKTVVFRMAQILFETDLSNYSVFQGFSKAKSANGGSILSSSQFLILPQLPQKIKLASKWSKLTQK
jgi:hypothetical protein